MIKQEPAGDTNYASKTSTLPATSIKAEHVFALPGAPSKKRQFDNIAHSSSPLPSSSSSPSPSPSPISSPAPSIPSRPVKRQNTYAEGVAIRRQRLLARQEKKAQKKQSYRLPIILPKVEPVPFDGASHIIFVVDNSASMKKTDVPSKNSKLSRTTAVKQCCKEFVMQQLQSPAAINDKYSIAVFNDATTVPLEQQNLSDSLPDMIEEIWKGINPRTGTQYILGLEQIDHLISRSLHLQPYVIFLSDGRPATEKHTVELLAAICEKYKDHWNKSGLKFTAIGFGNEDFSVLRQLCAMAKGDFRNPELKQEKLQQTFVQVSSVLTTSRSREKVIPRTDVKLEPQMAYKSEKSEDEWEIFDAHRQLYDSTKDKFITFGDSVVVSVRKQPFAKGGQRFAFHMKINDEHYVGKESNSVEKYTDRLKFHKGFFLCQNRATELAGQFNHEIQRVTTSRINFLECKMYRLIAPDAKGGFRYLSCEKFLDGTYEKYNGNNGYINPFTSVILPNSNSNSNDHNFSDICLQREIPQAFSHYTYVKTEKQEIVCDIQGVGFNYTDPTVLSVAQEYGHGDLGETGIAAFLKSHTCNKICRLLKLQNIN